MQCLYVQLLLVLGLVHVTSCATRIGRYSFHFDKKTWEDSQRDCNRTGESLILIETEQEWKSIKQEISNHKIKEWYIGLKGQSGHFMWVSGHNLTNRNWHQFHEASEDEKPATGEPECVVMIANYPPFASGYFKGIKCDEKRPYICEGLEINESTATPLVYVFNSSVTQALQSTRPTTVASLKSTSSSKASTSSSTRADKIKPSSKSQVKYYIFGFFAALAAILVIFGGNFAVYFCWMKRKKGTRKKGQSPQQACELPGSANQTIAPKIPSTARPQNSARVEVPPIDFLYSTIDEMRQEVLYNESQEVQSPGNTTSSGQEIPIYAVVDKSKKTKKTRRISQSIYTNTAFGELDNTSVPGKRDVVPEGHGEVMEGSDMVRDEPINAYIYAVVDKSKKKKKSQPIADHNF